MWYNYTKCKIYPYWISLKVKLCHCWCDLCFKIYIEPPSYSNGFFHSKLPPRQLSHCLRIVPLLGRGFSWRIQVYSVPSQLFIAGFFFFFLISKEHLLFIVTPSPSNGFFHSKLPPRQSSHCLRTVPLLGRGSSFLLVWWTSTGLVCGLSSTLRTRWVRLVCILVIPSFRLLHVLFFFEVWKEKSKYISWPHFYMKRRWNLMAYQTA